MLPIKEDHIRYSQLFFCMKYLHIMNISLNSFIRCHFIYTENKLSTFSYIQTTNKILCK